VWNAPALRATWPGVAARGDGDPIALADLARECVGRYGQEVLEGMIGRKIIEQACRKRKIDVTEADLDAEIARAAAAGVKSLPDGSPDVKTWLDLMTRKQGISLETYRNDTVWPSVALKKLAGDKVEVTEEDLQKGFEANYGPRVRCQAIVVSNFRRAQQVFELARRDNTAENFGELAAQYSEEPGSKALRGEVPPIKKYGGQPILEEEAFKLKPGELSGLIQVGDQYVILRCEGQTKAVHVDFEQVRDDIEKDLYEKKTRLAMAACYEELQEAASVDNFLTGSSRTPQQPAKAASAARPPSLRQVSSR